MKPAAYETWGAVVWAFTKLLVAWIVLCLVVLLILR